MAQVKVLEGTPEQLVKLIRDLPKSSKYRVTIAADPTDTSGSLCSAELQADTEKRIGVKLELASQEHSTPPRSLAELFAGRTGGVHGGGKAWSENTGKAFADGMAAKHGADGSKAPL